MTDSTNTKLPILSNQWLLGIATGVIGSVLAALVIQPIVGNIGKYIIENSGEVFRTAIDHAYATAPDIKSEAALLAIIEFIYSIFIFLWGTMAGALVGASIYKSNTPNHEDKGSKICKFCAWTRPFVPVTFSVAGIILVAFATSASALDNISISVNQDYNRKLQIIEPYITNEQLKLIHSQWALIHTKSDYEKLSKQMDDVISKANIRLVKDKAFVPTLLHP